MALASELTQGILSSRQADFLGETLADSLTATGTTQAAGFPITSSINRFTVVTGAANAATMPLVSVTKYSEIMIRNDDAADNLVVFPGISDSFNNQAIDTSITIAFGASKIFKKITSTKWVTT